MRKNDTSPLTASHPRPGRDKPQHGLRLPTTQTPDSARSDSDDDRPDCVTPSTGPCQPRSRFASLARPDWVAQQLGMWFVKTWTCQPSTRSKSSRESPVAQIGNVHREESPRASQGALALLARRSPPHGEALSIASWTWFNRLVRRLDDPRDTSSQVPRGGLTPNAIGHGSPRVPGLRPSLGVSARHVGSLRPPCEDPSSAS